VIPLGATLACATALATCSRSPTRPGPRRPAPTIREIPQCRRPTPWGRARRTSTTRRRPVAPHAGERRDPFLLHVRRPRRMISGGRIRPAPSPISAYTAYGDPRGAVQRRGRQRGGRPYVTAKRMRPRSWSGTATPPRRCRGGYHKLLRQGFPRANQCRAPVYNTEGELIQVVNERDEVYRYEYSNRRPPSSARRESTCSTGRAVHRPDAMGSVGSRPGTASWSAIFKLMPISPAACRARVRDGAVGDLRVTRAARSCGATSPVELRFDRDAMGRILRETGGGR
jgi:hypothetical protein